MAKFNATERRALGFLGTLAVKMFGFGCCWVGLCGYIFLATTLNSGGWRLENQGFEELAFFGGASAMLLVGILYLRFIDHQRRSYLAYLYREGKLLPPATKG